MTLAPTHLPLVFLEIDSVFLPIGQPSPVSLSNQALRLPSDIFERFLVPVDLKYLFVPMYNPNSCRIAQGGVGIFEESVSPPPKPFAGRDGVDHRIVVSCSNLGVQNRPRDCKAWTGGVWRQDVNASKKDVQKRSKGSSLISGRVWLTAKRLRPALHPDQAVSRLRLGVRRARRCRRDHRDDKSGDHLRHRLPVAVDIIARLISGQERNSSPYLRR